MASSPIKLDVLANVRPFQKGIDDLERSLDDVADAIDDTMRDGDRSTERMEDSFRDLARAARKSGDDTGDAFKRGMRKASDGVDDFKGEAQQTARETAASFDGSADSIVDMFQETAANALGGFGPLGAVAGLAIAGGIGLGVAGFDAIDAAKEASAERAAEWADAFVEAGGRVLTSTQTLAMARAILTDPERYKELTDNAREWGVTESVALLAMSGNTDALTEATRSLAEKRRELNDIPIEERTSEEALTLANNIRDGAEALDQLNADMRLGTKQADVYSTALRLTAENTVGAKKETDDFGDTIVTLPDGKQIYIDAETGQATESVDAIENKVYGIRDKTVRVDVDVNDDGLRDIESRVRALDGRSVAIRVQGQTGLGRHVE